MYDISLMSLMKRLVDMEEFNNKEFKRNGGIALVLILTLQMLSVVVFSYNIYAYNVLLKINATGFGVVLVLSIIIFIVCFILYAGLKIIRPKEALVLTLFGKYYGTIKEAGFYYVNPFVSAVYPKSEDAELENYITDVAQGNIKPKPIVRVNSKISLKAMTLNNRKQKVNDGNGNPIEIGVVVIWKVIDPVKAVFNVEDYRTFVSIQSDSAIRTVARQYAYDGEDGEKTLTGSTQEISDRLQEVIQASVIDGGIEIVDAKIAHLAYAQEIASAMLQRQQADAIIAARQKIVEGAVGMVEQALQQLSEREVVHLDDERRAQMVSNLLVVLCANKETQPIVNSGSIY